MNKDAPIIDAETFEKVQKKLSENASKRTRATRHHPFAHRIICGDCGEFYGHKVWHKKDGRYDVWHCNRRYDKKCGTPTLQKDDIESAFIQALTKSGEAEPKYSDDLWREKVDTVTVYKDRRMRFHFTDGAETEVQLKPGGTL